MSLLEVKDLEKTTADGFVLNNISFTIDDKGIYGFFGETGSGKTLLSTLICGACEADGGSVIYKDNDICRSEKNAVAAKRKIGYVPAQCHFASDATLVEVLDFTGRAKKVSPDKRVRQIKEALSLTGLEKLSDVLVEALTPSEKKRLAYANALIGNPDVVIVDEPIAIIDAAQKDEIKNLLGMLGKMKVVILFSKNANGLEGLCSHVAILSGGKLAAYESLDALQEKLNESVSALLRVRCAGLSAEDLCAQLVSLDGVIDVKPSGTAGQILEFRLECNTRDGMTTKIGTAVEALGASVVSLKFSVLSLNDVIEVLSAQSEVE